MKRLRHLQEAGGRAFFFIVLLRVLGLRNRLSLAVLVILGVDIAVVLHGIPGVPTLEVRGAGVLLLVESEGRERFIQIGFAKE